MMTKGSLVCIGTGMLLGAHLGPLAKSQIEQADVVFANVSDGIVELWVQGLNPDVRSLQPHYREGKSRRQTYAGMLAAVMAEVRAGRRVCLAIYGHPGVFARMPHAAVELARAEGYQAHMEPGISAEDCLYADLGIDPGWVGCQHYEATQMMIYRRRIDPSAYLVLWQVGISGDRSLGRFATGDRYRQILVDVLARDYPLDHPLIVYRAATLPIQQPRIEHCRLCDLPTVAIDLEVSVVLPPAVPMSADSEIRARLAALDREHRRAADVA